KTAWLASFLDLALKRRRGCVDLIDFGLRKRTCRIAAPAEPARAANSRGTAAETSSAGIDYILVGGDGRVGHDGGGIARRVVEILGPLPGYLTVELTAVERGRRLNRRE